MRVFARFEVRSPGSGQKRGNICRASEILVKGAFLPVPVSREGGALRAPPPPPAPPPSPVKKIAGLPLYPTPVPCGVRASTEPGPGRGRRGPKKMSSEKTRGFRNRCNPIKIVSSSPVPLAEKCEKCEKWRRFREVVFFCARVMSTGPLRGLRLHARGAVATEAP